MQIERKMGSNVIVVLVLALSSILSWKYIDRTWDFSVDDSYITYRYADNFKNGYGLVFNIGEKYYGSTAVGYALTLGAGSMLVDSVCGSLPGCDKNVIDVQKLSIMLSALSLGLIALCFALMSGDFSFNKAVFYQF